MNSTYNLIFPCFYWSSHDKDRIQCKCCLKITEDSFNLLLLTQDSGQTSPSTIKLSSYDRMTAKQGICTFESEKEDFSLIFLDPSFRHQNRFLYSLVDSCCIIPSDLTTYIVMDKPLYVPNGQFQITEQSVTQNIHSIFKQRFFDLTKNSTYEVDSDYVSKSSVFFAFMLRLASQKFAKQNSDYNPIMKDEAEAGKWLLTFTPMNSNEFGNAQQALHDVTPEIHRELRIIQEDAARYKTTDKRWFGDLSKICLNVCLALTASEHPYLQGEFDICARIALTIYATFPDKVNEETVFNAMRGIVNMVPLENRSDMNSIKLISDKIHAIIKTICPQISYTFEKKCWTILSMFTNAVSCLYAKNFNDDWKLWRWIFDSKDKVTSLSVFCASVLLFALPIITRNQSQTVEETMHYWDNAVSKFSLDELLLLSNYLFYHCFNSESTHPQQT